MSIDRALFLLFVATLPIYRPFRASVQGFAVPVADFVFVAAALAWMLNVVSGRARIRPTRFYLALGLYLAALAVSAVFSINPRQSAVKLLGTAYLVGIAALTVNMTGSWTDLKQVLGAWLTGTALTVVVGLGSITLFLAGVRDPTVNIGLAMFGGLPPGNYPRIDALFHNPNMLCHYLGIGTLVLPVMHALGWLGTVRYRLLSIGTWVTSVFSLSPGLGGLLLGWGLFRWRRDRDDPGRRSAARIHLIVGVTAAVVFLAALVIAPVNLGRGAVHLPGVDRAIEPSGRVVTWQAAARTFIEYPVLGQGIGTPAAWVARSTPGRPPRGRDAHNIWLSIGAQAGMLGLAGFAGITAYLWHGTRHLPADDERTTIVKLGFRAAFVSSLLYQGLGGAFEDARHLWVFMGLMASPLLAPSVRDSA